MFKKARDGTKRIKVRLLNPTISIITLTVNGLTTSMKRQRI